MTADAPWHTIDEVGNLLEVVAALRKVPCWQAAFSYGDELYLDLGARRTYESGPMAGQPYGEWELFTRASPWCLSDSLGQDITSSADDRSRAEPLLAGLASTRVTDVAVGEADLTVSLEFANGQRLEVTCGAGDGADDGEQIACWELTTPDRRCLEVWPGGRWRLVPYERT